MRLRSFLSAASVALGLALASPASAQQHGETESAKRALPDYDGRGAPDTTAGDVAINGSGGALASNPMFSGGGIRVGEAAARVWSGEATMVLPHATSGPALQQNLVCTLASSPGSTAATEGAGN